MTDLARTVATEMMNHQARTLDWQIEQSRAFEKQVLSGFESLRAATELSRDLGRSFGKTWLDTVLPAKDAPKA